MEPKNNGFRVKIEDVERIFREVKNPTPVFYGAALPLPLAQATLSPPLKEIAIYYISSGKEISIMVYIGIDTFIVIGDDKEEKECHYQMELPMGLLEKHFHASSARKTACYIYPDKESVEPRFVVLKRKGCINISAGQEGTESAPPIPLVSEADFKTKLEFLAEIIETVVCGIYAGFVLVKNKTPAEPDVILYIRGPVLNGKDADENASGGEENDDSGGDSQMEQMKKSMKSAVHRINPAEIEETLADVQGIDEAKEEIMEVVDFMMNSDKYRKVGAKIPRGVLLTGPPGTGKSMLAKAVAKEAGVPFFSTSGSEFVEVWVGQGAGRVRALFKEVRMTVRKEKTGCIVFFDEFESLGGQRSGGAGGSQERDQTLAQLLAELDGFEKNKGIVVMAATNAPEFLDKAVTRPGRFDRHIALDLPDAVGREAILRVHAKNKPLEGRVDLRNLALSLRNFSGAQLASLLNEAALLAARAGRETISLNNIIEAKERVLAGSARRSVLDFAEKLSVAHHEVGHAIVATILYPATEPVEFVTIEPRGTALGKVVTVPEKDTHLLHKHQIEARIVEFLAGRVAEEIFHGKERFSTGAEKDLEYATDYARRMVTEWGMGKKTGLAVLGRVSRFKYLGGSNRGIDDCSEKSKCLIDDEVRKILNKCYKKARKILRKNKGNLDSISLVLAEHGKLDGATFRRLLGKPLKNEK